MSNSDMAGRRADPHRRHVLIIVQNMPVPLDRRVWQECQALTAAGYEVSVICPKGPGDPARQVIDGVAIYKYRPAPATRGVLSFALEFLYCWLRTAWLSVVVWRDRPFDVIQACNPPDTYWLLAALWRRRKVRFVFDQHDLNPELFISRFGRPVGLMARAQYRGLRFLERMTYRFAHHVISTNESYKRIAIRRGQRSHQDVTVVRSGPDTARMRPIYPPAEIRGDAEHLLVYLGVMGPQDNVDLLVDVMDELVHRRGRTGVKAALLGFGDCLEDLRAQAVRLDLQDHITFTGQVGAPEIADHLSAADIGLGPDLKTALNDLSTMNKTMEYMCYCLPSVCFDLVETRVSAGDTALYVPSGDVHAFADAVERLLDDDELRVSLGLAGRQRVAQHLDWRPQSRAYVSVYDRIFGRRIGTTTASIMEQREDHELVAAEVPMVADRLLVPLDDSAVLRDFVLNRSSGRAMAASVAGLAPAREPVRVAEPVASIIIPAHDESRVIGRLLRELTAGSLHGEFEIVVVCNGCTDDTAEIARKVAPDIKVLETPLPSKRIALRLGDGVASIFPRLYVDADVVISADSVRRLAHAVRPGAALAGGPTRRVCRNGVNRAVRWYYDLWEQLPQVQTGLYGRGVIALSQTGHERTGSLPLMMADDLVMSDAFRLHETAIVKDASVVIYPPRCTRDLFRRRVRAVTGIVQAAEAGLQLQESKTTTRTLTGLGIQKPGNLPKLFVFLALTTAARYRAGKAVRASDYDTWLRDESSRREQPDNRTPPGSR